MAAVDKPTTVDQERADMEEVCRLVAAGQRVTDPALRRRIRERSLAVQKQIVEKFGIVDWAVEMIREARDEE